MSQDQVEPLTDEGWYGEDVATFGDRLAAAREAAGLKQGELAKRLGIKRGTLANWEGDLSEPRANRLSMMAGLLNVSVGWLLTGDGDGVEMPDEEEGTDTDLLAIVQEIRVIRSRMKTDLEKLARLEKALRNKV
jgi:transcriptional regulator with XRE-family HTH domain